ncbi:DUF1349 domain-containing protein [Kutzneria viridogrisea]|uniref:DUF1349 domain-containing protein n=2 Tax=Kutzneria TaxID=43356 RepID=W5VZS4_9PSEU|nr:DUF1349 domain-containing protein [Kutzneria albida]AHH94423.1 hypothetical protein KALB_1050 [Kutzneria albida DSM 43870]MBA8930090.1 hypothetical protein [Kutzneria viridogrisea]
MIEAFGFADWQWLNEPGRWSVDSGLTVHTDPDTDFWRVTHYGFVRDTGHLFARRIAGDFRLVTTFTGAYTHQYDQAGAMVRTDPENWLKTGIELVDGHQQASAVLTRGVSDWSVTPIRDAEQVTIEVRRTGDTLTVRYGLDGAEPLTMLRLAWFAPDEQVWAGVMCASPDGPGCAVRFDRLELTEG